jgi:hypothetical protein
LAENDCFGVSKEGNAKEEKNWKGLCVKRERKEVGVRFRVRPRMVVVRSQLHHGQAC